MENLYKCGFAFFRDHGNGVIELENKFTGLRLFYDVRTGVKSIKECAI